MPTEVCKKIVKIQWIQLIDFVLTNECCAVIILLNKWFPSTHLWTASLCTLFWFFYVVDQLPKLMNAHFLFPLGFYVVDLFTCQNTCGLLHCVHCLWTSSLTCSECLYTCKIRSIFNHWNHWYVAFNFSMYINALSHILLFLSLNLSSQLLSIPFWDLPEFSFFWHFLYKIFHKD